jgi:uncharacterized membrane protein
MTFDDVAHAVGRGFELAAILVLAIGFLVGVASAVATWRATRNTQRAFRALREVFGGGLLIGVEILVAADLISTVAVEPTLDNVGVLGLIVLIRTFLSFSLETEIEGTFPWRRGTRPP